MSLGVAGEAFLNAVHGHTIWYVMYKATQNPHACHDASTRLTFLMIIKLSGSISRCWQY